MTEYEKLILRFAFEALRETISRRDAKNYAGMPLRLCAKLFHAEA